MNYLEKLELNIKCSIEFGNIYSVAKFKKLKIGDKIILITNNAEILKIDCTDMEIAEYQNNNNFYQNIFIINPVDFSGITLNYSEDLEYQNRFNKMLIDHLDNLEYIQGQKYYLLDPVNLSNS